MAAKKYAYYIKGNKLALIQVDESASTSDNEYGMYKSPTEAVTDGIELQYAHTPSPPGNEGDDIGLMRYQSIAVVYFVKAKLAEDTGDMEQREFFMREFRRQLEKGSSALKGGPHIVQGFKEMR
tara:strand:- start:817 stop:1188 length:372 start_codon:yes stop_codon:yes gene_type:complete